MHQPNNNPRRKELRKLLRNNATQQERKLWECLKARRVFGYKFRRQHGIERYILDFYCPRLRIGIEIDGLIHRDPVQAAYDIQRDLDLSSMGIRILRFSNQLVDDKIEQVLARIKSFIQNQTPS